MNLITILQDQARMRPTAPAIIDASWGRDRITTFSQLEDRSARAAALLWQKGLRPGDAVLVFYPMSAELYVVLLALFRLGLVAMFLDPSAGREHIERCCQLQAPRAFIGSTRASLLCLWSPALRAIPRKFVIGFPVPWAQRWSKHEDQTPHPEIVRCDTDAPALLTFTSGSTGQPKAALRTHGFLRTQHEILARHFHLQVGAVDLATMPIVLLANLASGVTSVVPTADLRFPGSVRPAPILRQIEQHGVVSSVASPAFFECLARAAAETRQTLPQLQRLFTGGAAVFPRNLQQMQALAPSAEVVAVYGSTEAEPIAHMTRTEIQPDDDQRMGAGKGLLAGRPIQEIELRILRHQWGSPIASLTSPQFASECTPTGTPGEIVVSGDHVLKGYLHGHGDEETKFRVDGVTWHRTGDAGYLDSAGRLWLLGRCGARIQDDRGELYPFAAETVVYEHAGIRRAAVVAHRGQRVLAVEYFSGTQRGNATELIRTLQWASIDKIQVCREVPVDRRHNAKIDYPALYRLLDRQSPPAQA